MISSSSATVRSADGTTIAYTRRARPYVKAREVEDVAALLEVAGGGAALWHRHIRRAPIVSTSTHVDED
jgi:hypothetical protein